MKKVALMLLVIMASPLLLVCISVLLDNSIWDKYYTCISSVSIISTSLIGFYLCKTRLFYKKLNDLVIETSAGALAFIYITDDSNFYLNIFNSLPEIDGAMTILKISQLFIVAHCLLVKIFNTADDVYKETKVTLGNKQEMN
ncbi:hypothetical protein [Pectobacterium odoriferum]|uniref:hypothetical protein n=1 Tax=Pectobacterium odoriferum TaxID=78398 RepID=UPI0015DF089B|nr:hypothetical protein [Pectobacterium odoriferum]MBA0190651.1 hypothetical protein [Pectobacterium odoriferum]